MTKWREVLRKVPRSIRATVNTLGIVLVAVLFYVSIGSPAVSIEQQFRREENANFVGPAAILDILSLEDYSGYYPHDQLVIAASEDGVTLFSFDVENEKDKRFTYRKKMGDVTVLAVPTDRFTDFDQRIRTEVPIILVDSFPDAVRAEMQIVLSLSKYSGGSFSREYVLNAERKKEGYFLFKLSASSGSSCHTMEEEGEAIWLLTYISGCDSYNNYPFHEIPAIVRLYDRFDNLICERSLVIRSVAGELRAQDAEQ